ncbi:MAG: LAGLIDADG family homing endonuclease [Planctomycetota bacterium]
MPFDNALRCGWIDNQEWVNRVVAELPMPLISGVAEPGTSDDWKTRDVLLWEAEFKVLGELLAAHFQHAGTCFPAGTPVVMADGSEKPIELIQHGDMVLSYTGKPSRVIDTMRRRYVGEMVKIRLHGCAFAVRATTDHPVLVVQNKRPTGHGFTPGAAGWQPAELICPNDRVLVPYCEVEPTVPIFDLAKYIDKDVVRLFRHPTISETTVRAKYSATIVSRFVTATPELCWALGLYLAEGCPDYCRITISLASKEEAIAAKFVEVIRSVFGVRSANYVQRTRPTVRRVRVNNSIVARFFSDICPGGALTKRLPAFVFALPRLHKLELLRGWIDGDGHVNKRHQITGVSSSHGLARDFQRLCGTLHIRPSLQLRRKAAHQRQAAAVVEIYGNDAAEIYDIERITRGKNTCRNYARAAHGFACRVKSVVREQADCDVFNLEVEDEHSYVAGGLAVHNCVGHGWTRLAEDCILWAIGSGQAMAWPGQLSVAVNYAGSRVEVGGGKLRGDGSVGAWAAQWVSKYGVLPKKVIGGINLDVSGQAEDELARRWGRPGAGVPDALEPEAKLHPIETVSLADDIDTALGLLANGYAGAMCSNLAFQTVRNAEGVCEFNPRDRWPHCMEVRGVCRLKSGEYVVAIQQSWGNNPTGPNKVTLYSGREVTLPEGVFFIRLDPFAKGIAAKDTFFGSGVKGFPRRPIDWMLFSR